MSPCKQLNKCKYGGNMATRRVSAKRLDRILNDYAIREVDKMSAENVLSELKEQGINSIEDLVKARLDDFKGGGEVAKTTFIYEQFIYKESRVLDESLIDVIEAHIRGLKK